jgi:2-keto-4-pentenoate hydratase/2-oxohepta-3-ene-1,7-dioic acid hydratase in catechol pathway
MEIVAYKTEQDGRTERGARMGALLNGGEYILDFANSVSYETGEGKARATSSENISPLAWFDLDGIWLGQAAETYRQIRENRISLKRALDEGLLASRAEARLLAPVPRPGKLICIGLNYRDHAMESGMAIPERPVVFSKFTTAVIGPGEPVVLPAGSEQVDYEAELAVVVGRRAKNVTVRDAMDYVLGYTIVNDVSARDFQFADGQWQRGKSCDTFAPMGQFILTTDELPNPHNLGIKLRLNGKTMQDSNTDQLIFGVPELISFLSQTITLEPGDVIATGTPPGVGFARKPPVFLGHGDVMEVEIEGLGTLTNPILATPDVSKVTD